MVRLYIQLHAEPGQPFDHSKVKHHLHQELFLLLTSVEQWGPDEILVVLNKVFAPYTMYYAEPVDWYTILTSGYLCKLRTVINLISAPSQRARCEFLHLQGPYILGR